MELYGRVRYAVFVDGMSRREAARIFGINRRTVEKMLRFSIPPGYRRDKAIRRPKLDAYTGIIDEILETDKLVPKKQRHTSNLQNTSAINFKPKDFQMNISTIKNLSSKISSEFSRMKSSKSLEDKLMNLGNMISLLSKQNEELADQMNKSLK